MSGQSSSDDKKREEALKTLGRALRGRPMKMSPRLLADKTWALDALIDACQSALGAQWRERWGALRCVFPDILSEGFFEKEDNSGKNHWHWAAARGNAKVMRELSKRPEAAWGIDRLDSFKIAPLGHAAVWGSKEAARALLRAGANPNGPSGSAQSPLGLAARYGQEEAVSELLAWGADPALEINGMSPMQEAMSNGEESQGHSSVVGLLKRAIESQALATALSGQAPRASQKKRRI